MKRLIWASALCLLLSVVRGVHAQPPVEPGPNQEFAVSPQAGPWMICAAYFTGPSAPDLAHQMVQQIRDSYHLPAYVFNYADEERRKQRAILDRTRLPFANPEASTEEIVPIPRHHAVIRVEEQCAVMIGGYPDENAAHAALVEVKKLKAPRLKAPEGVLPFGSVIDYDGKESQINPFATQSMVVRNPTVPHETQVFDKTKDPLLKTLNADEEYSMLLCPGKYTLAVKEYFGAQMIQNQQSESSGFLKMLGMSSSHAGESLTLAANNAHELADTLKKRGGFKPYVLHTRTSSVVSIGAFESPDDPEIAHLRAQLSKWQGEIAQQARDQTKKDPLGLYSTPVPIQVPHP